jgi:hypothetical protein
MDRRRATLAQLRAEVARQRLRLDGQRSAFQRALRLAEEGRAGALVRDDARAVERFEALIVRAEQAQARLDQLRPPRAGR